MTRKVVNPGRIKKLSDVTVAVEKWEGDLARLNSDFKVEVNEELRIGILLEMMPVTEVMVQHIGQDADYKDVKQSLLEYVVNREDFEDAHPMDTNNMEEADDQEQWGDEELSWIQKGGGKGKGKFQGRCWRCGQFGH